MGASYLLLEVELFHTPGVLRHLPHYPWQGPGLALFLLLAVAGFLFARAAKLPGVFYRRWLPVLLYPLLLILLWAVFLIRAEGDYSAADSLMWGSLHGMTLPFQYLVWMVQQNAWPLLEPLVLALNLLTPEDIEYNDGIYFRYLEFFCTWWSIGLPLFMHAAWLAGFGAGAWSRQDAALPAAQARRGRVLVPLVCLGVVTFLCTHIWLIERSIVGSREFGGPEQGTNVLEDAFYYYLEGVGTPDTPPSLRIEANHPRMDGATAFYPLYAAAFKAIYAPPPPRAATDNKEQRTREDTFKALLRCSKTREAYSKLAAGETDIIFAFEPSAAQRKEAEQRGVKLRFIPMGKEAFVFLAHTDNPVSSLTQQQIQGVYTRSVTDWKQLGGQNARILPFQRPQNSGSQTIMEKVVMAGKSMTTPLREEFIWEMGGVTVQIAAYRNEAASIGYSFRRYAASRNMENLKFLAVNGVEPSVDHIADGSYAFTAPFYAVVRDEPASPELTALLDWFSGPEGQALIAKVGYVPMR